MAVLDKPFYPVKRDDAQPSQDDLMKRLVNALVQRWSQYSPDIGRSKSDVDQLLLAIRGNNMSGALATIPQEIVLPKFEEFGLIEN